MDPLRDAVRKPLDDYEAIEAARVDAHRAALVEVEGWSSIPDDWTATQIADRIEELKAHPHLSREWQEFKDRAGTAARNTYNALVAARVAAQEREIEAARLAEEERARAEAEALRLAQEEQARIERARAEAAAEATRVAEAAAAEQARKVEEAAQREREAAAERERLAAEALERSEQEASRLAAARSRACTRTDRRHTGAGRLWRDRDICRTRRAHGLAATPEPHSVRGVRRRSRCRAGGGGRAHERLC